MGTSLKDTLYMNERILSVVGGLLAAVVILLLMIRLIFHIFRSVGLYRIAKSRGIRRAWLAWVPVGNAWIQGNISDQYRYVVKGRISYRRFALLWLTVASTALSIAASVLSVDVLLATVSRFLINAGRVNRIHMAAFTAVSSVEGVVALVCMVFHYLTVYDLYKSCTKRYSVLYLVLSIVFKFLEPVLLFLCRDKEEGMPPRRVVKLDVAEAPADREPEPTDGEETEAEQ